MNPSIARNPRTMLISAAVLCTLGVAGAVAAIIVSATGSSHGTATPAPITPSAPATHVVPAHVVTPIQPVIPAVPVEPVTPSDVSSTAVATLQRELGVLNYYEGPVNGLMTPATIQAIDDLQRQAGLPQNGVLTSATDAALMHELAVGDNQMGGNN
jgi:peptidoglycan hydrolase-like protein with peptidoglycan-binding domain